MLRYYITDRLRIGGVNALLRNIERLHGAVDVIQIRENDLGARDLIRLVRDVLGVAQPGVRVLVNDRADVALAAGAHGVHLRGDALPVPVMRRIVPPGFWISVACHSVDEVQAASDGGADCALLAPIFASPGKGTPLGLDTLRVAVAASAITVIALGGVDASRIALCEHAGAAGFAGISYFQEPFRTGGAG